jgi:hypothetical protein
VRFYLDNDVDFACKAVRETLGHDVWTTPMAARADAEDEDQALYAADNDAVLVTHDRRFAKRQEEHCYVRMILLRVEQPDGPDLLEAKLTDEVIAVLEAMKFVVIELKSTADSVIHPGGW